MEQAAKDQESEDRVQQATEAMLKYNRDYDQHTESRDEYMKKSLESSTKAGYASTPYTSAARQAVPGLTDSEVSSASARAHSAMTGEPLP